MQWYFLFSFYIKKHRRIDVKLLNIIICTVPMIACIYTMKISKKKKTLVSLLLLLIYVLYFVFKYTL